MIALSMASKGSNHPIDWDLTIPVSPNLLNLTFWPVIQWFLLFNSKPGGILLTLYLIHLAFSIKQILWWHEHRFQKSIVEPQLKFIHRSLRRKPQHIKGRRRLSLPGMATFFH
jgi:hypothetical protein